MSKVKKDEIISYTKVVKCSGSDRNSLHPCVYINFGDNNKICCPYCGEVFIYIKDCGSDCINEVEKDNKI